MGILEISLAVGFALLTVVGAALTIIGLPGVWMLARAAVLAQAVWPGVLGWWVVGGALAAGVLAELVDLLAGSAGAKAAGGSKSAMVAAALGAIAGAVLGTVFLVMLPILGTIIGAVLGAGLAAGLVERGVKQKEWGESAKVAGGAAAGRLVSIIVKGTIALVLGGALTAACLIS